MTPKTTPRVSLGMPVYNGEAFLEEALRSLLGQTFEDFELVISDNASTDRTRDICLDYAARDRRIRFHRNEVNLGFCRNQNFVIQAARGDYFLLTHHDDVRALRYLERTVAVMDADPCIVVCYTNTRDIDEHGNLLPRVDPALRFDSPDWRERFRDAIRMDHICEPDFGLTRLDKLHATRLHGDYADSDRVLLAELALHGPFHRIPDLLFYRRVHAAQSTAIAPDRQSRTVWFSPEKSGALIFPHFRQLKEYLSAIGRAPVNWHQRAWCYLEMARWTGVNHGRLFQDLEYALRQTFRPLKRALLARAE
jgi:glycosyltransferase involved in cell wall biosynthesis